MKSRQIKWVGHVARKRGEINVCKLRIRKPEWKRKLGKRGYRSEDNVTGHLIKRNKTERRGLNLSGPDRDKQRAIVDATKHTWVPYKKSKVFTEVSLSPFSTVSFLLKTTFRYLVLQVTKLQILNMFLIHQTERSVTTTTTTTTTKWVRNYFNTFCDKCHVIHTVYVLTINILFNKCTS